MTNFRRLLALFILLLVVALGLALWKNFKQRKPEEILEALPKQIDLSLDQLHYTQNEDGQKNWTLDADKAEYQRDNSQALLQNVHLTFYRAGEFGEVQLKAQQGSLQQEKQQVKVWGQVEVETSRGEKLFTDRLHYDGQQRLLTTQAPIRILAPRMELTGVGMSVDVKAGRLVVNKDVWMLLLPTEKKKVVDE